MWRCPVCEKENARGFVCVACGFDQSVAFERYDTLMPCEKAKSITALRAEWTLKQEILQIPDKQVCPECGGTYFMISRSTREICCVNCCKRITFGELFPDEPVHKPKQVLGMQILPPIAAGSCHTAAIGENGRMIATGENRYGPCGLNDGEIVMTVAAGYGRTVGLRPDGTVVEVGFSSNLRQCSLDEWTDIVALAAKDYRTVGVKADGTVVKAGIYGENFSIIDDWADIVNVTLGHNHVVGLKSDGTVVAVGQNDRGQCNVSTWTDIVAVAAGDEYSVGLRLDGTVVATGRNDDLQCDVYAWTDIVAISAGARHTVGLRSDGTVKAVGVNSSGQCNVGKWEDITAVAAGSNHTVGLKSNGTMVAVGSTGFGQCDVQKWTNIKLPEKVRE